MVAHQTSGAEVRGSNPTSPIKILMCCRIIVLSCGKTQGREEDLPLRQKKIKKNKKKYILLLILITGRRMIAPLENRTFVHSVQNCFHQQDV